MQLNLSKKEILTCGLISLGLTALLLAGGPLTILRLVLVPSYVFSQIFATYGFGKVSLPYVVEGWSAFLGMFKGKQDPKSTVKVKESVDSKKENDFIQKATSSLASLGKGFTGELQLWWDVITGKAAEKQKKEKADHRAELKAAAKAATSAPADSSATTPVATAADQKSCCGTEEPAKSASTETAAAVTSATPAAPVEASSAAGSVTPEQQPVVTEPAPVASTPATPDSKVVAGPTEPPKVRTKSQLDKLKEGAESGSDAEPSKRAARTRRGSPSLRRLDSMLAEAKPAAASAKASPAKVYVPAASAAVSTDSSVTAAPVTPVANQPTEKVAARPGV